MLINKLGDICLLISFVSLFYIFGSLNYDMLFCLSCCVTDTVNYYILQISGFFLFFGAMGKSAQFGLHT